MKVRKALNHSFVHTSVSSTHWRYKVNLNQPKVCLMMARRGSSENETQFGQVFDVSRFVMPKTQQHLKLPLGNSCINQLAQLWTCLIESPICTNMFALSLLRFWHYKYQDNENLPTHGFAFARPPSSDNQTQFGHIRVYILFPIPQSDPNDLGLHLSMIMALVNKSRTKPL